MNISYSYAVTILSVLKDKRKKMAEIEVLQGY